MRHWDNPPILTTNPLERFSERIKTQKRTYFAKRSAKAIAKLKPSPEHMSSSGESVTSKDAEFRPHLLGHTHRLRSIGTVRAMGS